MDDFNGNILGNEEETYKEILLELEKQDNDDQFLLDEKEANKEESPKSPKKAWTKVPKRTEKNVTKSQSFTVRKTKSASQSSLNSSVDNSWKKMQENGKQRSKVKRTNSTSSTSSRKSLNLDNSFGNAYSTPRQISSATWSMYCFDIQECIEKVKSIPKYAVNGFRILNSGKVPLELVKFEDEKTSTYERVFRSHVFLQIMMNFEKQIKYNDKSGKEACMKALFSDILESDISLKDGTMNAIISAARLGESFINNFYGNKIMLGQALSKNRFSLHGTTDIISSGEDRMGNKFKFLIMCKTSGDKFVLSKSILELFLHGLIMDIPILHLLYYHAREGSLAVYEFKFKYDKLREFNKTLKVSQICENLFKGVYGHFEYKIIYKDSKDIELSKRR